MFSRVILLGLGVALFVTAQESPTPTWKAVARMGTPRADHCAVSLIGGRVLVVGGRDAEGPLRSVEIYGPEDRFMAATPLVFPRSGHSCTLLEDGRVLVAGGNPESGAEVWDPEKDQWTVSSGDAFANSQHTATLLSDGQVLLAGGAEAEAVQTSLALYDPAANSIRRLDATMMEARKAHIAGRLTDGRVLLAGGEGHQGALRSSEIFDPSTETIWPAAAMNLKRAQAGAAMLDGGRLLAVAGTDFTDDWGNVEIYVESEDRWEWVPTPLREARRRPFVASLASGEVLIAGGDQAGQAIGATEIFTPLTLTSRAIGELTAPRSGIAGALISDTFQILATGGAGLSGPSPLCGTIIASEKVLNTRSGSGFVSDFDSGETVTATGSGFTNGVAVRFSLAIKGGADQSGRLLATSAVPSSTSFSVPVFTPDAGDIGKTFVLTASQGSGGLTLTATFSVRTRLSINGGPTASSSFAGTAIPFSFNLTARTNAGPVSGSYTLVVGPLSRTFTLLSQPLGSQITQSVCCVTEPGTYAPAIRFNGDSKYQPTALGGVLHTVNAVTLSLANGIRSLPLFEDTEIPLTVSLPAGTPSGTPAPTGTLTLSGAGVGPLTLTLSPSPRGNTSSASFRFRATFATRPQACFSGRYSGDARYPAQDMSTCINVGLARTSLSVSPSSAEYSFSELLPLSVRLTFPAEVGLVTRNISLATTATGDGTSNTLLFGEGSAVPLINISAGQASVDMTTIVQLDRAALTITYPGGGDLQSTSVQIPLRMRALSTQLILRPIPSPSFQPLSLSVFLTGCPVGAECGRLAAPTGTVRFFDGDLQLGESAIQSIGNASGVAALSNVTRPPGLRQFRAVYSGDSRYAPANSSTVQVTVQ